MDRLAAVAVHLQPPPFLQKVRTIITGLHITFDVQVEVAYIFVATTCLGVISLNDGLLFGFPCDFLYHNHKVNA